MQYRTNPKNGDTLSALAFGCMRLPRKGTSLRGGDIDMEQSAALLRAAVEQGVNYFDTAYIYPGSEEAMGKLLESEGLRDRVYLATKLPVYLCKAPGDFDRLFAKQLARLRTDRIDYYLIHMLADTDSWARLCALGLEDWIAKKKASGAIKNLGFSFHGGRLEFQRLVDSYDWDFVMIQYNYMDEFNQAGREGLCYAAARGLPVFVMEPLRGGMLVNGLPPAARQVLEAGGVGSSPAEWGLRWLWDQPEVTTVLSGMNAMEQLCENATLAEVCTPGCLTEAQHAAYRTAQAALAAAIRVPCTGCGYCMPCPKGVDIPTCFSCYNEAFSVSQKAGRHRYFMSTGMISARQSYASKCAGCGACEAHCPQKIAIRDELKRVKKTMENPISRGVLGIARRFLQVGK